MTPDRHACAARSCETQIVGNYLMCAKHWYMVPRPLRNEVWRAYRGEGVLSDAYMDSVRAAQDAVEEAEKVA